MVGGGSERLPRIAAVCGLALGLPLLMGASCRARPDDCTHDSLERCTWEEAVNASGGSAETQASARTEAGDEEGSGGGGIVLTETEQDDLDKTLDEMIEVMASGLEWTLADEQARELCRVMENGQLVPAPVTSVEHEDEPEDGPEIWRCVLPWLRINGVELELEASAGVLSLSADGLGLEPSESLARFAEARFDEWCAGGFEELEGSGLDVVHRCALPQGPYLVVARFPRDEDASTWQVSIAVVDAG